MIYDDWRDIRHIVINKIVDIEYNRKKLAELILSFEPEYELKTYHLGEIRKRIFEIENFMRIKEREIEEENGLDPHNSTPQPNRR